MSLPESRIERRRVSAVIAHICFRAPIDGDTVYAVHYSSSFRFGLEPGKSDGSPNFSPINAESARMGRSRESLVRLWHFYDIFGNGKTRRLQICNLPR
jgi:hypothetical protein